MSIWNSIWEVNKTLVRCSICGSPEEYPDRYQRITSENLVDKEHTPQMLIIYGTSDHYVPVKSTRKFIKVLSKKVLAISRLKFHLLNIYLIC